MSWPRLTQPSMTNQPPSSRVATTGTMNDRSQSGNQTQRRNRVYRSAAYEPAMSVSVRRIRRSVRPSASTVRAPSTVSASPSVTWLYAAFSRRYPAEARRRYQRPPAHSTGIANRHGRPSSGPVSSSAPIAKQPVTEAIRISGTANRTLVESAATSREVRVSRSPAPARSTVDSGRASVRRTNSSRSSASTCSPRRAEAKLATRTSTACTRMKPAINRITVSTRVRVVPRWIDSTRSPISRGLTRPATAASACRPSASPSVRGCRRSSATV